MSEFRERRGEPKSEVKKEAHPATERPREARELPQSDWRQREAVDRQLALRRAAAIREKLRTQTPEVPEYKKEATAAQRLNRKPPG